MTPDLREELRAEGFCAYHQELARDEAPYLNGSSFYAEWLTGWKEAKAAHDPDRCADCERIVDLDEPDAWRDADDEVICYECWGAHEHLAQLDARDRALDDPRHDQRGI